MQQSKIKSVFKKPAPYTDAIENGSFTIPTIMEASRLSTANAANLTKKPA